MLNISGDNSLDDLTDFGTDDLEIQPKYTDKHKRNIGLLLIGIATAFFFLFSPILAILYHKMVDYYYLKAKQIVTTFNEENKDLGFRVFVAENLMWIDVRLDYKAKEFIKAEMAKQDQEDPSNVLSPIMLELQKEFYNEKFPEGEQNKEKKPKKNKKNKQEGGKNLNLKTENGHLNEVLKTFLKKSDEIEEMNLINIRSENSSKVILSDQEN